MIWFFFSFATWSAKGNVWQCCIDMSDSNFVHITNMEFMAVYFAYIHEMGTFKLSVRFSFSFPSSSFFLDAEMTSKFVKFNVAYEEEKNYPKNMITLTTSWSLQSYPQMVEEFRTLFFFRQKFHHKSLENLWKSNGY